MNDFVSIMEIGQYDGMSETGTQCIEGQLVGGPGQHAVVMHCIIVQMRSIDIDGVLVEMIPSIFIVEAAGLPGVPQCRIHLSETVVEAAGSCTTSSSLHLCVSDMENGPREDGHDVGAEG